jgi:hypothetical protein
MRKLVVPVLLMSCVSTSVVRVFNVRIQSPLDVAVYANPLQKPPVNPVGAATAAFQKRVDEYLKLRNELTKKIPEVKETGDPAKIHSRETALGQAIAAARSTATPGDLFGAEMVPYFNKALADDWRSRSVADRKAIFHELPAGVKLGINQPYPPALPLLTLPANMLAKLPMLPEELEYRLIDRYLLLRDRDANIIVDMIPNVLPKREG